MIFFVHERLRPFKKNNDSGKCESFDCMTVFFLKTDFLSITFLPLFVSYIAVLKKLFIGSQGEERKGLVAQGRLGSERQGRMGIGHIEEGQGSFFTLNTTTIFDSCFWIVFFSQKRPSFENLSFDPICETYPFKPETSGDDSR